MSDMDSYVGWWVKMITLRDHLAHIPYAARHQREIVVPLYQEINTASLAGDLPSGLENLWQQHKAILLAAGQRAEDFADIWDVDFPVVKTRPG